jgi:predicted nucleic acid-binding protein
MRNQSKVHELCVNPAVYAELAGSFESPTQLDERLDDLDLSFKDLTRPALFLAGHVHQRYRRNGGPKGQVLADFFIGAHAFVLGCGILTRDPRRYRTYFPKVELISP